MYCPNCGTPNPENAQSCNSCGAVLIPSATTAAPITPKISGLAIAALVLGLLSFIFNVLTGIPAVILGIIALVKIEKSGGKITGKGFAITGIITPVLSFALIMVILMPALNRVRIQAQTVTCSAYLRQWSLAYNLYFNENDGLFIPDENWLEPLRSYGIDNENMLLCPMATKSEGQGAGTTFTAWKTPEGDIGSYGINGWVTCPEQDNVNLYGPMENYWRNIGQTSRPAYIPLMMDCRLSFACPKETDSPPISENSELQTSNHMQRLCMNRHNKGINMAFLDGHVEIIGLKELWIQKWHRTYDIEGPWTLKGGINPTEWPQWMRNFRDY